MPSKLIIPRRFHSGYSLLGLAIRKRIEDKSYAEGLYILVLAAILIGAVLAFYLGWALLQPVIQTDQDAFVFACTQVGVAIVIFVTCVWGYKPAVEVAYAADALVIKQGPVSHRISRNAVRSISKLSFLDFHRHYRKYRQTLVFSNRSADPLMLIRTDDGPVVLGLPEQKWESVRLALESPAPYKSPIEAPIFAT